MEESKLPRDVLSLLSWVQKNEGRKRDPIYAGVGMVSLWKNMVEIGSGVPQRIGTQRWER